MDRLESHEKFFRLQRRDQEKKYEQYANTPLNNLFAEGRAYYGTITGATEYGQLVLRFNTAVTPRLKVPMTFCLIKKKAYEEYDSDISKWECTSLNFRENFNAHTNFSDILPTYYLKGRNTIGCGSVSLEMVQAVRSALEQQMTIKFVMLETLPPTELLMNLAEYIKLHPFDENLLLTPKISYDEWAPTELASTENVADKVIDSLRQHNICILCFFLSSILQIFSSFEPLLLL